MPASKDPTIVIPEIEMRRIDVRIVGKTGLYCNRMSAKVKHGLLIGTRKKTSAERLEIKHDPRQEYLDTMYVERNAHPTSHIQIPAMAIKSAMSTAALAVPGIQKTQVQRLVFMPTEYVPLFGIPKLRMDITRSADINRTPDVRTRAYFEEWATELEIHYSAPALSGQSIITLLHNAGIMCGIGDNRQEKGKGSYGTFRVLSGDEELPAHLLDGDAQWDAIQSPAPANSETTELLDQIDTARATRVG